MQEIAQAELCPDDCRTPGAIIGIPMEGHGVEDEYEVLVWRMTTAMAVERSIARTGRCLCGRRPHWRERLLSRLRG